MRNKKPFLDGLSGRATSDSSGNTKQERNTYFVPHCCPVCVYISLFDNINLLTAIRLIFLQGRKKKSPFFVYLKEMVQSYKKPTTKTKKCNFFKIFYFLVAEMADVLKE